MHIKTLCPQCESTYQVDPGLKGKRMRCPNPLCRAVFEIRDVVEPATPAASTPPPTVATPLPARTGSVGDMVQILSAEIAVPEKNATPLRPSPFVPPPSEPAAATVAAPTAEQQTVLDDFFAGAAPLAMAASAETAPEPSFLTWDGTPPLRQQADETPVPLAALSETPEVAPPQHKWRWPIVALVLLLMAAIATTWWLLNVMGPGDELGRFARAEKDYKERNFGEAASRFRALVVDFPESEQRPKYQFYAELSELCDQIHRVHTGGWEETRACIARFDQFLELYKTEPSIDSHKADLAEGLYKLAEETISYAGSHKNRQLLEIGEKLYAHAGRFGPASPDQAQAIKAALDDVGNKLKTQDERNALMAELQKIASEPTADAVVHARERAASAGVSSDSEVKDLLVKLVVRHREAVQFSTEWAAEAQTEIVEDGPPSLVVLPFLGSPPAQTPARDRPVFAVVRGVLYAFDPVSGRIRWARHIGVDMRTVPVWLPPTPVAPHAVLVPSSDHGGLLALDGQTGAVLWFQPLPSICRGPVALIGQRAYVACRSGAVVEIDTAGGRCLGAYELDQALTWQGVCQPGTHLLYVAADRYCVYALDVSKRHCKAVVYPGHAKRSMLCGPVLVPLVSSLMADAANTGAARGKLLLSVARGSATTDVLTYALPFARETEPQPVLLESLSGRLWFPPDQNGEHVTFISDTGALAIFGVKQPNNLDPDLFARFRTTVPGGTANAVGSDAQVVHSDAGQFWLLAHHRLHCFQAGFDVKSGWNVAARHLGLEPLGLPLQDSQVQANRNGGQTLFVATEAPDGSSCWMSAIDAQHGLPLWQRQVGWMCKGQPLALGGYVLGQDTNGLLLQFAAGKLFQFPSSDWRISAKPATDVLKTTDDASWLLPLADGKTVLIVAARGLEARVSRFNDGVFSAPSRYTLEAPPRGTPAVVDDTVVLPLANGRLCRLLPSGKVVVAGEWRSPQADAKAIGHIVAVGPGLFASTNGSRGVTLWRFDGDDWQKMASATVDGRIVAPPVVVALDAKPGAWGLCVAHTEPGVTLLHVDGLRKLRHWVMSGDITAGPFVRGHAVGLVLGNRRLVLLDPNQDQRWGYTNLHADIVGQPELVDGLLIVADLDGRFQAIDPLTKQFVGVGYKLQANVAPAAAPVPFGADRLFVPLTDGTVLLLSREWFRPRILGFSTVR